MVQSGEWFLTPFRQTAFLLLLPNLPAECAGEHSPAWASVHPKCVLHVLARGIWIALLVFADYTCFLSADAIGPGIMKTRYRRPAAMCARMAWLLAQLRLSSQHTSFTLLLLYACTSAPLVELRRESCLCDLLLHRCSSYSPMSDSFSTANTEVAYAHIADHVLLL